jgi:hypothetical protein
MKATYRRILVIAAALGLLSSCAHYPVKTAQVDEHECYSTWHPLPENS